MNGRILLGVDTSFSPATQLALRSVGSLLKGPLLQLKLVLINVIFAPYVVLPLSLELSRGREILRLPVTTEQRAWAENALQRARTELQKQGIASELIESLVLVGRNRLAEEIVRAAIELQVDFIVIGRRADSPGQKILRFFEGNTSQQILQLAPCPVMVVTFPQIPQPSNLVAWYEEAITHYLRKHTDTLIAFTPHQVAQMFVLSKKKTAGHKEVSAAELALKRLASNGELFCHEVKGETLYIND